MFRKYMSGWLYWHLYVYIKALNWLKSLKKTYRVDKNAKGTCKSYYIYSVDTHLSSLHVWILAIFSLPFNSSFFTLHYIFFFLVLIFMYFIIPILCLFNFLLPVSSIRRDIFSKNFPVLSIIWSPIQQQKIQTLICQWFNVIMKYFSLSQSEEEWRDHLNLISRHMNT